MRHTQKGSKTEKGGCRFAAVLLTLACVLSGHSVAATGAETPAATSNPHVWKPQTRSVAVFKNGLGFFVREGAVGLRDGWCVASEVPPAAFGTLAIYAKGEKQAVDIVGSGPGEIVEFDGHDASKDVAAKRARLEANKNLKVHLHYKHKTRSHGCGSRS